MLQHNEIVGGYNYSLRGHQTAAIAFSNLDTWFLLQLKVAIWTKNFRVLVHITLQTFLCIRFGDSSCNGYAISLSLRCIWCMKDSMNCVLLESSTLDVYHAMQRRNGSSSEILAQSSRLAFDRRKVENRLPHDNLLSRVYLWSFVKYSRHDRLFRNKRRILCWKAWYSILMIMKSSTLEVTSKDQSVEAGRSWMNQVYSSIHEVMACTNHFCERELV